MYSFSHLSGAAEMARKVEEQDAVRGMTAGAAGRSKRSEHRES